MRTATETSNGKRAHEYHADRRRAERGAVIGPPDAAILRYTGQYLHGATVPRRMPDAVAPALLPEVMRVIATAERACAGMRIGRDPRRGKRATDRRDWDRMATTVDAAVRRAHPELADDAVRTVSFLMCSEAADRSRSTPMEDDEEAVGDRADFGESAGKTILSFTDDKGVEKKWFLDNPRTATAEFWEFVGDRSAADNEVSTIEDEKMGEGIQLHFYADSIARITTVHEGKGGSDPQYRVEYSLVDGIGGYRNLVSAFVRGGCAALEQHGSWMSDAAELERARRRRDAGQSQQEPAHAPSEGPAKERVQESARWPTQPARLGRIARLSGWGCRRFSCCRRGSHEVGGGQSTTAVAAGPVLGRGHALARPGSATRCGADVSALFYIDRMIAFSDFNFKLLVIEKLMYWDEVLTPQFSLGEHMREQSGITDLYQYAVDNDLAYTVFPEARAYFEGLDIPDELLLTVDELTIDGGHQVYQECAPVWDGEDELFDVRSLADLALVPNLQRIVGADEALLAVPDKLDVLAAHGVAAH